MFKNKSPPPVVSHESTVSKFEDLGDLGDLCFYDPRCLREKVRPFQVNVLSGGQFGYVGYFICSVLYEGFFIFIFYVVFNILTKSSCCHKVGGGWRAKIMYDVLYGGRVFLKLA